VPEDVGVSYKHTVGLNIVLGAEDCVTKMWRVCACNRALLDGRARPCEWSGRAVTVRELTDELGAYVRTAEGDELLRFLQGS
jgi:hypothetical protein